MIPVAQSRFINSIPLHSEKFPSLDNKLYAHFNYRLTYSSINWFSLPWSWEEQVLKEARRYKELLWYTVWFSIQKTQPVKCWSHQFTNKTLATEILTSYCDTWEASWLKCQNQFAAAESLQSCPTLCNATDSSPPGSPIPGILQARTLEWVAISFTNAWKWKVKVKLLSRVRLFATPWTAAHQAPPSMEFARQEY